MTETFLIYDGNCNNISYFTAFFGDKMQICHVCALNTIKRGGGGVRGYGKSLNLLPRFAVSLKLLSKSTLKKCKALSKH